MGLYDTITCEHALPDGCTERTFQSKSLGCMMLGLRLTADGRLLDAAGRDTRAHGVIRFYTPDARRDWHEYEARFDDGLLTHLLPLTQARYQWHGAALMLSAQTGSSS